MSTCEVVDAVFAICEVPQDCPEAVVQELVVTVHPLEAPGTRLRDHLPRLLPDPPGWIPE